jgi:hypothetical protein
MPNLTFEINDGSYGTFIWVVNERPLVGGMTLNELEEFMEKFQKHVSPDDLRKLRELWIDIAKRTTQSILQHQGTSP